ncbi:MAG: O-antigen ligase family protein [Planctomycetales bacterium]|nr:O-antigen ligase family protein [Planctomycetales bacterium]
MPAPLLATDLPPCWLSFAGPGWGCVLVSIFLATWLAARGRGCWWAAIAVAAVGLASAGLAVRYATEVQAPLLERWDLRGPYAPWKNSWLKPLEGAGYGVHDDVEFGQISCREDAVVVGIPMGVFVNRNQFALSLAMSLPVAVALALSWPHACRRRWSRIAASIAGGALAGVIATGGLFLIGVPANCWGALGAVLIAVPTTFALGVHSRLATWCWSLVAVGMLLAASGSFFVLSLSKDLIPAESKQLVDVQKSLQARMAIWDMALEAWRRNPLLGCGWGEFQYTQPESAENTYHYAHNEYVHLAAESGLAGVLVLGALLAWAGVVVVRRYHASRRGGSRNLLLGVVCGLLALLLHSGVDFAARAPLNGALAAILLGLATGMGRPALSRRQVAAVVIAAGALAILGTTWLTGDWQQRLRVLRVEQAVSAVRPRWFPPNLPDLAQADAERRWRSRGSLSDALAAAEQDWHDGFADRDDAMTMATGYLQLSRGESPDELQRALIWLQRAQSRYPLDSTAATIGQLTAPPAAAPRLP